MILLAAKLLWWVLGWVLAVADVATRLLALVWVCRGWIHRTDRG